MQPICAVYISSSFFGNNLSEIGNHPSDFLENIHYRCSCSFIALQEPWAHQLAWQWQFQKAVKCCQKTKTRLHV